MTKETVTTLTMKTTAAFALQSAHNKAARAEILELRDRVAQLEQLITKLMNAAPVMQVREERLPREAWRAAHASLVAEATAAGKPARWFSKAAVIARAQQLAAEPAEIDEYTL